MKALRPIGLVLLLLASFVAPAVACLSPQVHMTHEEQACCRMMNNQCGQMSMPGSHDCCRSVPSAGHKPLLKTDAVTLSPTAFVALWLASRDLQGTAAQALIPASRPDHSPPKPPPTAFPILRL